MLEIWCTCVNRKQKRIVRDNWHYWCTNISGIGPELGLFFSFERPETSSGDSRLFIGRSPIRHFESVAQRKRHRASPFSDAMLEFPPHAWFRQHVSEIPVKPACRRWWGALSVATAWFWPAVHRIATAGFKPAVRWNPVVRYRSPVPRDTSRLACRRWWATLPAAGVYFRPSVRRILASRWCRNFKPVAELPSVRPSHRTSPNRPPAGAQTPKPGPQAVPRHPKSPSSVPIRSVTGYPVHRSSLEGPPTPLASTCKTASIHQNAKTLYLMRS